MHLEKHLRDPFILRATYIFHLAFLRQSQVQRNWAALARPLTVFPPFSLRLGQHPFISTAWDLRRCHIDTQLSGGKGTCLLWPISTLPLLWKSSSLSARWPGVKVSSERPQPLHCSLLYHGPRPNIEDSQGLGCPKWLKGRVFWQTLAWMLSPRPFNY